MEDQIQDSLSRESSDSVNPFTSSTSTENDSLETGIDNGSFETGDFINWRTIGDTSVETEDLGIFPSDGTYQALLTNGYSDSGGSVVDSDLEEYFDLAPGSLDGLVEGDATEGSGIKQTFIAEAGDVISFDWNFLTNESTPDLTFNDTAFLTVNGITLELADTGSDFVDAPGVEGFAEQTETQNLTFSVAEAGEYTIGFGVVDVKDNIVDSRLIIDNIQQIPLALFDSPQGLGVESDGSGVNLVLGLNGFESVDSSPISDSETSLEPVDSGEVV
ncbi:hypothetical protein [Pleurocapsa sp. PCC 7319]|uniref:hypothetical protein n=1 Tax=Pleurocapsa sp. PCC 7319 TaxID=118161 RepID=UPI000345C369|nr:hypothetical protein [Pleurocapsa sp. PCC 7319]